MGYYTQFSGEINIDPPIDHQAAKDSTWLETDSWNDRPYPVMISKCLDALVPSTDDEMKAYSMTEDVEAIISQFPGHNFNGMFECEGEEAGDLWRLVVKNNVVSDVRPMIVWPED